MSIFRVIMSRILGSDPARDTTPQPGAPDPNASSVAASAAPPVPAAVELTPVAPSVAAAASARVDVEAVLTELAAKNGQALNWRQSIVDLMKLLGLDSSLSARRDLAAELHFTGDANDSAAMNIWLHSQVMKKLAENGGKVSADLIT